MIGDLDLMSRTLSDIRAHAAQLVANGATPEMLARSVVWLRHQADTAANVDPALYRTVADIVELEVKAQLRLRT